MKPGKMPHRVAIQSKDATTADTLGEDNDTYTTVATVWAEIRTLDGRELWQAQQASADVTHTVTMRYYPTLTAKHRLLFGARVFNIVSVSHPDEDKRSTVATVKEEA